MELVEVNPDLWDVIAAKITRSQMRIRRIAVQDERIVELERRW